MRSMLILLFLCSLAFAAEPSNKKPAAKAPSPKPTEAPPAGPDETTAKPLPECGWNENDPDKRIYRCLAPSSCILGEKNKKAVRELIKTDKIFDNCPAIFQYYMYNLNHAVIVMRSFDPEVTSIEFVQKDLQPDQLSFKCANEKGKLTATFESKKNYKKDYEMVEWDQTTPLNCTFVINSKRNPKGIFNNKDSPSEGVVFKYSAKNETKNTDSSYIHRLNMETCDPTRIYFNQTHINSGYVYKKVSYGPGKTPYCEDKYFTKEYRSRNSPKHAPVADMDPICDNRQWKFSSAPSLEQTAQIDMRCVAEAADFCNYKVKGDGKIITDRNDTVTPNIMELKCPNKTHLEVKGKIYENGRIECRGHGDKGLWTFFSGDVSMILRGNGPEVNCLAKIECHKKKKIPASALKNGDMNNNIPECRVEGKLKLESTGEAVTNVTCDGNTGDFMYKTPAGEKKVEDDTVFVCEYPSITDTKQNQKNLETMGYTILTTLAISAGVAAAIVGLVIALSYLRVHLLKKQMIKQHKKEWHIFAINKKERKKLRAARAKSNPDGKETKSEMSLMQPMEDLGKINPRIMECRLRTRKLMNIESMTMKYVIPPRHAEVSAADSTAAYDTVAVYKKAFSLNLGDLKTERAEKMDTTYRDDFFGPDPSEDAKEPEKK